MSLTQDHERAYWKGELGLDDAGLDEAVACAGRSAKAVRAWLKDRS